ncbi:hypothetical protein AB0I82_05740 [Streptomyces sp. NPDC050315]|uniref:hypothetical protein n=1 Tax=Streptomyces sp. NPDC050315 TaxID=3155039 RepID=UPI003422D672
MSREAVTELAKVGTVLVLDVPGRPGLSADQRPRRAAALDAALADRVRADG